MRPHAVLGIMRHLPNHYPLLLALFLYQECLIHKFRLHRTYGDVNRTRRESQHAWVKREDDVPAIAEGIPSWHGVVTVTLMVSDALQAFPPAFPQNSTTLRSAASVHLWLSMGTGAPRELARANNYRGRVWRKRDEELIPARVRNHP